MYPKACSNYKVKGYENWNAGGFMQLPGRDYPLLRENRFVAETSANCEWLSQLR
jgi:hypothetical protein